MLMEIYMTFEGVTAEKEKLSMSFRSGFWRKSYGKTFLKMLQEFVFPKTMINFSVKIRKTWIHHSDTDFLQGENRDKDNQGVGNMGHNYAITYRHNIQED